MHALVEEGIDELLADDQFDSKKMFQRLTSELTRLSLACINIQQHATQPVINTWP